MLCLPPCARLTPVSRARLLVLGALEARPLSSVTRQALIDSPDQQLKRLGRDLMRETKLLFAEVARCRDGTITHTTLQRNLSPVRHAVEALLLRGHGTAAHGMCRELFTHKQHLWTFLSDPQVEPTNNAGERSLHCSAATALGLPPPCSVGGLGCFWRKLSFGTQSERGDRFVETLLTIIETCRQQNHNVHEYVTHALQTKTPPTLTPHAT